VSPTHPVAVCYVPLPSAPGEARLAVRVIRPNGTLGAPLPLPDGAFVAGFSPDGKQVYVSVYPPRPPDQPQARPAQTWSAVDVATNAVTPLDNRPAAMARDEAKPQTEALPVRLAASMGQARRETTAQNLRSVWLEAADPKASNEPRALVTPDCDQGVLSDVRGSYDRGSAGPDRAAHSALLLPDASAVLYRSGDALFAVPLRRYPKAAFLDARRRAQQAAAMSNAKQIGVALMMYTQDYDETLPVANEGFMDQVSPYLADRDLFNNPATGAPGFVYTHSGGLLSAIMNPGESSIGYLVGPGGRAVLFADGMSFGSPIDPLRVAARYNERRCQPAARQQAVHCTLKRTQSAFHANQQDENLVHGRDHHGRFRARAIGDTAGPGVEQHGATWSSGQSLSRV
jgi:hypothetical protein